MRRYLFPSVVILALAALGASALAVGIDNVLEQSHSNPIAAAAKAKHSEADDPAVEQKAEHEQANKVNHGHCVSYWSHRAKEEDVKGKARGEFVSTIAKNEAAVTKKVAEGATPESTCDFAAALEQAKTASSTATEHGKSEEEHGKSADHRP